MSEIGLFQISYKRNGVYQSILVRANSEEQAKQKLLNNLNGVDIIGVNSHPSPHFHEPILDSKMKDINQVLLSNLKQVAQKGDAWWNKWKKLLDMSDKWNSYQWKELRNNDPKKYQLIINNKQYAEKEAEALNREWDRAIDALSRDRSFGKPGDYRMDLHSYKSHNDNYPMGNSDTYNRILYGYEQAEKSAREKKGLDSSIKDAWSGIRSNGVIFNYSDGKYTITHKNGKVETFPGNKFNTVEELFKYIDNIKDSSIKDSGINYGTLFIDLNSPNELTASRIVQELKKEIGNNKIAEIRGGSFTPLREYGSAGLDLDFKEFKNNEWGTNHIRLSVRSEFSLPVLMKMKDDPKSEYKLRAELNNKLKQFANKTIYSNKSFTMDSAIKDEDYSKYLSIVKQLEKLVEPTNRALQQKIAKYGVTKQDIRNNSPKYRDVCREIPELKVWAKLIMQLPGELAGFMPAHPSQESVDKLKKAITNSKAFDSDIK